MSVEAIAEQVIHDVTPGMDGFSNAERARLIREIFGFSNISITANYDWQLAIDNGDPMVLIATYHLANLQRDFFLTILEEGGKVDQNIRYRMAIIERVCQRLVWELTQNDAGRGEHPYIFRR